VALSLIQVAQDQDPTLGVEVHALRLVDHEHQGPCVFCGGPEHVFLGPVIEDELQGELAGLAPLQFVEVAVDLGDLADLDRLLRLLLFPMLLGHDRAPPASWWFGDVCTLAWPRRKRFEERNSALPLCRAKLNSQNTPREPSSRIKARRAGRGTHPHRDQNLGKGEKTPPAVLAESVQSPPSLSMRL
jgi:hypothetical protein